MPVTTPGATLAHQTDLLMPHGRAIVDRRGARTTRLTGDASMGSVKSAVTHAINLRSDRA